MRFGTDNCVVSAKTEHACRFYTAETVTSILGIPPRTLRAWHLRGLLRTEVEENGNAVPDKWRRYTVADIVAVAVMRALVQSGFSARSAGECVNHNRKYFRENPTAPFFIVSVGDAHQTEPSWSGTNMPGVVMSLLADAEVMAVVAVHSVAKRVYTELENLYAM